MITTPVFKVKLDTVFVANIIDFMSASNSEYFFYINVDKSQQDEVNVNRFSCQ
jgi:hypothetical protein